MNAKERKAAEAAADKERAVASLRKMLPPGSVVYTFGYGRTRSPGVRVAVFAIHKKALVNISPDVSSAMGSKWFDENAVLAGTPYGLVAGLCKRLHGNDNVGQDTPPEYRAKYATGLIQMTV